MAVDLKPLLTLLAIVNPLACVPFFIHYTQNFSQQQRQHTILVASFSAFVVIGLATAVCFALAQPIARVLGKTGINIMTRLMGLILTALAVELIAEGLHKLFPVLAH